MGFPTLGMPVWLKRWCLNIVPADGTVGLNLDNAKIDITLVHFASIRTQATYMKVKSSTAEPDKTYWRTSSFYSKVAKLVSEDNR